MFLKSIYTTEIYIFFMMKKPFQTQFTWLFNIEQVLGVKAFYYLYG